MSSDQYHNTPQGLRQPGQSSNAPKHGDSQAGDLSTNPSAGGSGYASADSSGTKSPLQFGLGFLKGLGSSDRKTRDGQPAKRRGPKPDSKPALTRRQELNRQAQRTHRERKEVYIKTLEQEVMQLKEVYTGSVQEKLAIEDENRKLKDLLSLHGITYDSLSGSRSGYVANQASSSGQASSSYGFQGASNFSPQSQPMSSSSTSPNAYGIDDPSLNSRHQQQQDLDYDQLGVDFVLASVSQQQSQLQSGYPSQFPYNDPRPRRLEAACMDHLQFMCVRSNQDTSSEPATSGHAAMWSCPPYSHIDNLPEVPYPHKLPSVPSKELMKLLTLSQDLPLDGELTPVIALNMLRNHPRFGELTLRDFERIKDDLKTKTRCYGFGAVLEEFELRDALSLVFATKADSYNVFQ